MKINKHQISGNKYKYIKNNTLQMNQIMMTEFTIYNMVYTQIKDHTTINIANMDPFLNALSELGLFTLFGEGVTGAGVSFAFGDGVSLLSLGEVGEGVPLDPDGKVGAVG